MRTLGATYLRVGSIVTVFVAFLALIVSAAPETLPFPQDPEALIQPVLALVALTALVWFLMVLRRNIALIRRDVTQRYFQTYTSDAPMEWVERPARTYMNLLELPLLFYVGCVLMLVTGKLDNIQVALAWLFVATRYVHALIYIGFNDVPLRFTAFFAGSITLGVLWARFAIQALA